jgi:hypothetical protein
MSSSKLEPGIWIFRSFAYEALPRGAQLITRATNGHQMTRRFRLFRQRRQSLCAFDAQRRRASE